MNFDEMDLDTLSESDIIKMYNDIIDSSAVEYKLHILAGCQNVGNGSSYCK